MAIQTARVELGEAIRGLRRYHGLTQRDLEELSGLDQSIISRLETGRHVHVRLWRLLALLGAMQVARISFRSRHEAPTVVGFMSRHSHTAHSDVMRPPIRRNVIRPDDEPSEFDLS